MRVISLVRPLCVSYRFILLVASACLSVSSIVCAASDGQNNQVISGAPSSSLYVKVQLEKPVKAGGLKSGDLIEGKLAQDVYSGDQDLFPAGSRVQLVVDHLETRRRVPNDHWPWVVKAFTPRHEKYPTFQTATVFLANGRTSPLRVSLISISNQVEVRSQAKSVIRTKSDAPAPATKTAGSRKSLAPIVILEASLAQPDNTATGTPAAHPADPADPITLVAGTQARIVLLGSVSASKSPPGDVVQARVVEPVTVDSRVILPEGTLFEGKVVKSTRPRWLSRSGSLLLNFTNMTLPGKESAEVTASVAGVELDQRSHTKIDPEGQMKGDRPGKAWMALNLGVTAGIAKVADDGSQLVIEAIVSTATDASTAGAARIVAACASGVFLITRHGRDIVLPRFTEMSISFDRPVSLAGGEVSQLK